jgi:hypothetical protein
MEFRGYRPQTTEGAFILGIEKIKIPSKMMNVI